MKNYLIAVAIVGLLTLAGCGGGGGSSTSAAPATGPVTSTNSFPLQTGYKALIANGSTFNFNISGTCTGTGTISSATPVGATFEGAAGLSVTTTETDTFTNCTPASIAQTSVGFYDTNYSALGHVITGVEYGKFLTGALTVPTSAKVGDTAVVGTETIYTDSTKAVLTGTRVRSYVIEADTASTAIANLITKGYNASNQLLITQQSRYRMDALGTLTILSMDAQASTTSTNHFIYTAK